MIKDKNVLLLWGKKGVSCFSEKGVCEGGNVWREKGIQVI